VIAKQVAVKDAASKEVGTMEYPNQVVVEGAGSAKVNGVYKRSGMYKGAPKYVMDGKWEGIDGKLQLRRGKNRGSYYWYIDVIRGWGKKSIANFQLPPSTHSPLQLFLDCLFFDCEELLDCEELFYIAPVEGDNTLPSKNGWRTAFCGGKEPAPQIKY
jgi:hypothetical protein